MQHSYRGKVAETQTRAVGCEEQRGRAASVPASWRCTLCTVPSCPAGPAHMLLNQVCSLLFAAPTPGNQDGRSSGSGGPREARRRLRSDVSRGPLSL